MSWRTVVISSRAKLDLQLGYLVVRGIETKKVHLSEIAVLIVESTAVSLTAALLAELTRQKIKVIFCDEKRNPSAELLPCYGSHDTSSKLRAQIAWPQSSKEAVWAEIVRNKIINQSAVLRHYGHEQYRMLEQYACEIIGADETNREGHAAKVYFNALFGRGFSRANDDAVNAALNYGYAILLSAFNREIVANGYTTQLGIHHGNVFNCFNLGSDLMEPFRPLLDYHVMERWRSGGLEVFDGEEKINVLRAFNQKVMIGGKSQVLLYAIGLYCKSVFAAIQANDASLLDFCALAEWEGK